MQNIWKIRLGFERDTPLAILISYWAYLPIDRTFYKAILIGTKQLYLKDKKVTYLNLRDYSNFEVIKKNPWFKSVFTKILTIKLLRSKPSYEKNQHSTIIFQII